MKRKFLQSLLIAAALIAQLNSGIAYAQAGNPLLELIQLITQNAILGCIKDCGGGPALLINSSPNGCGGIIVTVEPLSATQSNITALNGVAVTPAITIDIGVNSTKQVIVNGSVSVNNQLFSQYLNRLVNCCCLNTGAVITTLTASTSIIPR